MAAGTTAKRKELLTSERKAEFHERGFLHYGRVMTEEQTDALRERMFEVIEGRSKGKAESVGGWGDKRKVIQIVNIWEADDLFRAHLYNPTITQIVSELMDTDTVRVWHDQVQFKPPLIGGPTDWHQDHPYWPIIQPADLISAWVALEDADVENGCMWMTPGSHKWGAYNNGTLGTDPEAFSPIPDLSMLPPEANRDMVACPVKKGEVMFHHCLTWHGSRPNDSERGRPAIAVHYMPGYTRYEPNDKTHMVEHNIEVAAGEPLIGRHFPTVYENRPLTPEG